MTALGHLCAIWSALEFHVDQVIWELANVERYAGACLTGQMIGPGPRGRALVALVGVRNGNKALIKDFNAFAREFGELGAARNRYVHDAYGYDPIAQEMKRVHKTADKVLKFDIEPFSVADIHELHDKITDLVRRFDDLYFQMLDELPPWPRTQYEQSPGIFTRRTDRRTTPKAPARPRRSSRV
ncbi:MAG TPA: hypothetical protein VGU24_08385 [Microvirga sp.]|jgi:hypothetical protein|nr:hypothetical protein [Microvirga sp.]